MSDKSERTSWRLLIVEDDPVVASMYRRLLRATSEFEVRDVARNGTERMRSRVSIAGRAIGDRDAQRTSRALCRGHRPGDG